MIRLHHVNLGVPVGGEQEEESFLVDVLGFRRVEPGPDIRAMGGEARWFEDDEGGQIHLSIDAAHHPAAKAHVAVELGERLSHAERWIEETGRKFGAGEADGKRILVTRDPAGNRWELRGPLVR